uniref:Transposase (Putative), gypsy type n=1 Tax=Tanacetum cinerariifolium TaxID=118510 RepID=A0A6L2LM23_TANCI|nr:hypothetical protein [Tanacetum cinerariifolium]
MSPSLGDVAVVGTAGTIPRLYQYNPNGSPFNRDTVQLETAVNTISQEYLLEFTSEYGIPEALYPELPGTEDKDSRFPRRQSWHSLVPIIRHRRDQEWMSFSKRPGKNTPQCYTKPLDSLKNWNNRFFWVDEGVFPTVVDWRTSAPKDGMPAESTYSVEAVRALDTHRTPIQKQLEMLLCVVGISCRYYLGDEVYPTFFHDDDRDMDLFNLIRAPNPTKVKIESRPRAAYEVLLLTLTANRVIDMEDPAAATDSSGVPSTIERSPLDFANEAGASDQGTVAPEVPPPEDVPATSAPGQAKQKMSLLQIPLRSQKAIKEAVMGLIAGYGIYSPCSYAQKSPADVNDPDPLSFADPQSRHPADIAQSSQGTAAAGYPESGNASFASAVGSPESIYRPECGVANGSMLDTPEAYQDLVDHVAMGSQLRLRFEQEAKLLRKFVAQVAHRDKRIQARKLEIKNLEALLEAEADMKKAAEDKSARLSQELKDMRALFSDLQVSNYRLSQQVATLQEQVSGEEKLKTAFEKFKQYEDSRVEQRCAEIDARLDALSIDFDEELYHHMLTAIADVVSAGIAKGMSEGLKHEVEHGQAQLSLESIEAYDLEAKDKYVAALQALKDLKYPLVDQLEGLKDAPMDVIMTALYLESDTGDDAPQQEEMLLADAIAANISRAEKKKKCRVVCRTHGVGSAHHARSDGVPVSVPTGVPQGFAILLADAATQTEPEETT